MTDSDNDVALTTEHSSLKPERTLRREFFQVYEYWAAILGTNDVLQTMCSRSRWTSSRGSSQHH